MYAEDSFFTLTMPERVGLLLLTVCLSLAVLALVWRMARNRSWPVRLAIGLIAFVLFEWLSPQVYYSYYLGIFDTLPFQIVVGWPPTPMDLMRLLTFSESATLSHHGRGVLGWLVVLNALAAPQLSDRWRA